MSFERSGLLLLETVSGPPRDGVCWASAERGLWVLSLTLMDLEAVQKFNPQSPV